MNESSASVLGLSTCPCCGYPVHDRIAEFICPECGLELSAEDRCFGGDSLCKKWGYRPRIALLGIALLFCFFEYESLRHLPSFLPSLNIQSIWLTVSDVALFAFMYWVVTRSPRYCVVVGPRRVAVVDRKHHTAQLFPTESIQNAKFKPWTGLALHTDTGEHWLHNFVQRESEGEQCAARINSLLANQNGD